MNIPKSFETAIENTFYDKKISVLDKAHSLDAEGGYIMEKGNELSNFMGNVSFSNFKAIKEEYGLEYNIDISITTSLKNKDKVDLSTLISYKDKTYEITDKFERDSHLLLIGVVWE